MAKPKLALIPATIGTKVYSVLPSDGDGDFAFTRATAGTRINSLGLIEEVDSGKNRLNYDLLDGKVYGCPHLLLEPARTNSITKSDDFNQWGKINVTVTSNSVISPDGTPNADKLIATSGSSNKVINQIVSANTYTASVFAKKGEFEGLFIGTGTTGAFFNLNTHSYRTQYQSAPTSYKIEKYNNGWYRYSVTFTISSSNSIYIGPNDNVSTSLAITGDGSKGIYIYGAQAENGTYPTSYIKTTGSAVTRNAEVANGSGNASTFNDSEGVLMFEGSAKNDAVSKRISISDGSFSNRISLDYTQVTNTFNLYISNKFISAVFNVETNNKLAFKYKNNDCSLFLNGFKVGVISSVTVPVGLDTLQFTDANETSSPFYGNTKQIQYFDSVLADSELEELTSWVSFQEMANGQLYTIE